MSKYACMITLALAAACGGAKNDSDPETGGDASSADSSGSDAGSGSHTGAQGPEPTASGNSLTATESAGSGVEPTTTGVEPTTTSVEPTTTGVEPTSGVETTTSGDVTMTTGEEPTAGLCEEYCEHAIACMTEAPAGCLTSCAAQLDEFAGDCRAAALAFVACKAGMTCDELVSLGAGDPGPCEGPLDKVAECGDGCSAGGGGDVEGMACVWMLECPLAPKLQMDCDTETCQCSANGLPTGSCAAEGACLDIETLADKMSACCGF